LRCFLTDRMRVVTDRTRLPRPVAFVYNDGRMSGSAPFGPMERATRPQALEQLRQVRTIEASPGSLDAMTAPVAVINAQRQVVYANREFRQLADANTVEELCGKRPGEILGCRNARGACGESAECRLCGAAQAILETQTTGCQATRECHIASLPGQGPSFDLLVRSTPFEVQGATYLMVTFSDISDQRRHQALERIFFHDILNTASSFRVYLDLLKRESAGGASRAIIDRLESVCDTMVEEIQGQRLILSAENHTLRLQSNLIDAQSLVEELIATLEGLQIATRKHLRTCPESESFAMISDDTLVRRILGNMLKNALEASEDGETVTLKYQATADRQACFEVHNGGCIDPVVQRQIFHRYFSTKGKDRGLGTWGMRLLAEEYLGGCVSFESTAEAGTTFKLLVPLKPQKPA